MKENITNEMDEEIQCNNCGWTGDSTMLVSKTDALDDKNFNYCPDCSSDDIEDIADYFHQVHYEAFLLRSLCPGNNLPTGTRR